LEDCGIGFGRDTVGGKNDKFYVVIHPYDDAMTTPSGTLRHGVIQTEIP
jgi:pectate lyase